MDYDKKEEVGNSTFKDLKANNSIGRLALSKSICRFELPMDMKQFESIIVLLTSFIFLLLYCKCFIILLAMTPAYYLEHYCKVNDRRKALYRRVFDKYKLKSEKEDYVDLKVDKFYLLGIYL